MGKAVNTASATVKKGTIAMVVVKVRLLAVRPSRSSRKRSPSTAAVFPQGKCERSLQNCQRFIAGIMPEWLTPEASRTACRFALTLRGGGTCSLAKPDLRYLPQGEPCMRQGVG